MVKWKCDTCEHPGYKTEGRYKKHKCKGKKKEKRPSINGPMRKKVWDKYIGQKTDAKCFCCRIKKITPFSSCHTFEAGHIISHHNEGKTSIENLLPICRDCNRNMGSENWDIYVERNAFPPRIYGKDPPIQKYVKGIIWTQSLVRMWLERQKEDSCWRLRWKEIQSH